MATGSMEVPSCSRSSVLRLAWPGGGPGCSCWGAGLVGQPISPGEHLNARGGEGRPGRQGHCSGPGGIVGNSSSFAEEMQMVSFCSCLSRAGWGARVSSWFPARPPWPDTAAHRPLTPGPCGARPDIQRSPGVPDPGAEEEMDGDRTGREPPGGAAHASSFVAGREACGCLSPPAPPGPSSGPACPSQTREDLSVATSGGA